MDVKVKRPRASTPAPDPAPDHSRAGAADACVVSRRGALLGGLLIALGLASCAATRTPMPAQPAASAVSPAVSAEPVSVRPQTSWADAVLYFVVLDRFADGNTANNVHVDVGAKGAFHGGDLVGLTERLDELSGLGVTALWITPVVKNIDGFVTGAGFPDWAYHGYWADDVTSLDPRFGTEAELKALVDAAHARGMKVLLDVVYNHAGYDSAYVKDPSTRTWLRTGDQCGVDDITSCLAGLPDFKTEREDIADHLMDAHLGLAKRVGLDGFRLDTVKHVTMDFWRSHRRRVDAELGEHFFLLGEVWGGDAQVLEPWFEADALDAGFDFGFVGSTLAFLQGRGRPVAFGAYLERRRTPRDGHLLAHYLSSHDVPGALYQLDGDTDRFRLLVALQMTVSGIPTVYYGEEVGRFGGDWPDNRSDMPWGDRDIEPGHGRARDETLRAWYQRLIEIRREHPALWRGSHQSVDAGADHLIFLRDDPQTDDAVLVAINRGSETLAVELDAPEGWSAALPELDDEVISVVDGKLRFPVPALSLRILSRQARDTGARPSQP